MVVDLYNATLQETDFKKCTGGRIWDYFFFYLVAVRRDQRRPVLAPVGFECVTAAALLGRCNNLFWLSWLDHGAGLDALGDGKAAFIFRQFVQDLLLFGTSPPCRPENGTNTTERTDVNREQNQN